MSLIEAQARRRLSQAGVELNGPRPYDLKVYDWRFYPSVFFKGSLGLGEAYMRKWCDCDNAYQLVYRLITAGVRPAWPARLFEKACRVARDLGNPQNIARSRRVGRRHYDISPALYEEMLEVMNYSCAYYDRGARTLREAQLHKMDLICEKLQLKPGMRVLDIGCGWGTLAAFMAEHHGVDVCGVTISAEQARYARRRAERLPVRIALADYRKMPDDWGSFDRIVSVGMFEHVGPKNHRAFMECAAERLAPHGRLLLHSIDGSGRPDLFLDTYIFPGGVLPRKDQIREAASGIFHEWDWHTFGQNYARTLLAWNTNLQEARPRFESEEYDEEFWRRMEYYLQMCAAAFRAGLTDLSQIVYAKETRPDGYQPVR